jgi:hypothetical protein
MAIGERTVCDKDGNIESIKGALCPVNGSPYQFYAGLASGSTVSSESIRKVRLVMPVGGEMSGLYRFPRVGEKVLVENGENNTYYLLGYVPDDTEGAAFTAAATTGDENEKKQKDDAEKKKLTGGNQGLILRYKNSDVEEKDVREYSETGDLGKKYTKGKNAHEYSEIGFFRKRYKKGSTKTNDYKEYYQDELKMTSAGYAVQETEKTHAVHANGIEILSGLDPVTVNEPGDTSGRAVGDAVGEIYALGEKDVQIRAGGEVVIKAAKKIVLQVGRSQITIDDTGIKLLSKKINSNWTNTFDTSLDLNARTGISMFGDTVGVSGGRSVNIGDSYGGGFASNVGEVSVTGREIALNTLDTLGYLSLLVLNGIDLGFNAAAAGLAKNGDNPAWKGAAAKVKLSYDIIKKLADISFKFFKTKRKTALLMKAEAANLEALAKRINELEGQEARSNEHAILSRELNERMPNLPAGE